MTNPGKSDAGEYERQCYQQEKALFCFLYFGLSAIDTLVYGLFFLAARRYPCHFPATHPNMTIDTSAKRKPLLYKQITLERVSKRFCEELPADPLSEILSELRYDIGLKDWRTLRNIFTHRFTPHRHSFVVPHELIDHLSGTGNASMITALREQQGEFLELTEGEKIPLDENTTATRLTWLGNTLADLVNGTNQFIDRHYPKSSPRCMN